MIVNRCVEQGIYVILILSLEKDHRPLRSVELSSILDVSDSYLKKILRKLVLAGLIHSNPGKDGGFVLARPVEEISVYDVYAALEGEECEVKTSGIGERIFIDDKKFEQGAQKVMNIFGKANKAFARELQKLSLADLADREHYLNGTIEFGNR